MAKNLAKLSVQEISDLEEVSVVKLPKKSKKEKAIGVVRQNEIRSERKLKYEQE